MGELVDEGLYIYQVIDGQEVEVAGEFTLLDARRYAFTLTGAYDPSVELIIDPDLAWSTYLGGSGVFGDYGVGIAVDASGNALVAGEPGPGGPVTPYLSSRVFGGFDKASGRWKFT